MTPNRRTHLVFGAALAALLLIVIEGLSYGAIAVLNRWGGQEISRTTSVYAEQSKRIRELLSAGSEMRELHDGDLGWRYRPGFSRGEDEITEQGLRGDRVYSPRPANGKIRIAAFGDSFVYGNEVAPSDAWTTQLEELSDSLEVLNFGVGGYGTDQALLRYRIDGRQFAPHIVLIGFAPIDMRRNVNVYRRFLSTQEGIAVKPRFRREGGQLVLIPNPVPSTDAWRQYLADPQRVRAFGEHDQWYRPLMYENPLHDWLAVVRLGSALVDRVRERYLDPDRLLVGGEFNPEAEAFALQLAIFGAFIDDARRDGAHPYVVILPDRTSVDAARAGQPTVSEPLITAFQEDGVLFDGVEAFVAATGPVDDWFMPGGHYSPSGNRVIAEWLYAEIVQPAMHRRAVIGKGASDQ